VLGQPDFTSNAVAVSRFGENNPSAVGFDPSGNLWVSDQCNSRLLEFKRPFTTYMPASLVIGQPDFTSTSTPDACFTDPPPPTTSNVFYYNDKFTFDKKGNLWIADGGNNRVLEFEPPFSTGMAPSLVIGQPDFTSSSAAATQNGFNFPTEPAFDKSGDLWVADIGNNRVLEFKHPFHNGMSATRVIGQPNFTDSTCATTRNGTCSADGIAFDSSGDLWVGDAFVNNRILEFRHPFTNGMNASVVIGQDSFDTSTPAGGPGGLNFTLGMGLTFDQEGNLWVGDTANNRVFEFQPDFTTGMDASLVIGQTNLDANTPATTQDGLSQPIRPAFDSAGNLWIPDATNSRVLEYVSGGG
jgi:sugar lactone lactonase YvrE